MAEKRGVAETRSRRQAEVLRPPGTGWGLRSPAGPVPRAAPTSPILDPPAPLHAGKSEAVWPAGRRGATPGSYSGPGAGGSVLGSAKTCLTAAEAAG